MTHRRIRTAGHDALLRRNLNRRRCEGILSEHSKDDKQPRNDENLSTNYERRRNRRPSEPMVQGGDDERGGKRYCSEQLADFLAFLRLGAGTGAQTPFQKPRI